MKVTVDGRTQYGILTRTSGWLEDHSRGMMIIGLTGLIGLGAYEFGNLLYHAGEVRSERVVKTLHVGQGNYALAYHRNIKFFDDDYRWEMRDKDGRVFLMGNGSVTADPSYFALKSDSLSNELEKSVNGTAAEK